MRDLNGSPLDLRERNATNITPIVASGANPRTGLEKINRRHKVKNVTFIIGRRWSGAFYSVLVSPFLATLFIHEAA